MYMSNIYSIHEKICTYFNDEYYCIDNNTGNCDILSHDDISKYHTTVIPLSLDKYDKNNILERFTKLGIQPYKNISVTNDNSLLSENLPLKIVLTEAIKQSISMEECLPAELIEHVAEKAARAVMKVPCIEAFSEIRNQLHMRNISKREEWNDKEEKLEDFLDRVYPETKIAGGMIPSDFKKIDKNIYNAMYNDYRLYNKKNPNENRDISYFICNNKEKNLDRLSEQSERAFGVTTKKVHDFFLSLRSRFNQKTLMYFIIGFCVKFCKILLTFTFYESTFHHYAPQ